jgi:hypothetical protein
LSWTVFSFITIVSPNNSDTKLFFNIPTMAPNVTKKYKAAAVNAEPGWLDLELSVEKTIEWINEAGKNGCKLVAFPELCKSKRANPQSNEPSRDGPDDIGWPSEIY